MADQKVEKRVCQLVVYSAALLGLRMVDNSVDKMVVLLVVSWDVMMAE